MSPDAIADVLTWLSGFCFGIASATTVLLVILRAPEPRGRR